MSSIQNAMSGMGYVRMATFADDSCRACDHSDARPSGLRCTKGAFYVSPAGSCNKFEARATEPQPIQIGPTDI